MTDQSIFDEDRGDVSFTDDGICDENAYDERPEPLGRTELEASMLMRDVLHDIVDVSRSGMQAMNLSATQQETVLVAAIAGIMADLEPTLPSPYAALIENFGRRYLAALDENDADGLLTGPAMKAPAGTALH